MIEIFATNVASAEDSLWLKSELLQQFPDSKISFDLEDCDRILRIERFNAAHIATDEVIRCLQQNGFECKIFID
ncbi:MAG: hypothetical protein WC716_00720 [Chitinophagaceae bacterium]|jgi:hypothetical protein